MIIDSHAYCWSAFDAETSGYDSPGEKLSWLMHSYASHHQPALRLNDGAVGDASVLLDGVPKIGAGVPSAGDLSHNFRLDKAGGRAVWDVPGEGTYTKYFCRERQHFSSLCPCPCLAPDPALSAARQPRTCWAWSTRAPSWTLRCTTPGWMPRCFTPTR